MIENTTKRQWYRLRGWSVKFLEELQHSGGKTTRMIADGTLCKVKVAAVILQRMRSYGLIERIEGWGWKIALGGLAFFDFISNSVNNNYINSKIIDSKHEDNTNSKPVDEIPTIIPSCFSRGYCTIKRFWKDKRFTKRAEIDACGLCVCREKKNWDTTEPRSSLEVKGWGVIS